MTTEQLIIDGQRADASNGGTFEVCDPSTGGPLATVSKATKADLDRAVKAAHAALESKAWGGAPPAERGRAMLRIIDILGLLAVVLGGIILGWFSPSEASSIGTVGALLITFWRGRLTRDVLFRAFTETMRTAGLIFLVIVGALTFAVFISVTGLTDAIGAWVTGLGFATIPTLVVIAIVLLLLGSVLDGLALMLLMTLIMLPIAQEVGMSAVWFGIFITRAMEIGFVHPPLGMNLYIIQGVAKDVSIGRIFKGVLPFLASDFVHLLLLILFPVIVLWLPEVLGN